jgi:hypothetical protein
LLINKGLFEFSDFIQVPAVEGQKTCFVMGNRPVGSCKHNRRGLTSLLAPLLTGIIVYECVVALSELIMTNVDLSFRKYNLRFYVSSYRKLD